MKITYGQGEVVLEVAIPVMGVVCAAAMVAVA